MTRLLLSVIVVLTLITGTPGADPRGSGKPNVVVILADDQGWGDLSVNGNTNLAHAAHRLAGHATGRGSSASSCSRSARRRGPSSSPAATTRAAACAASPPAASGSTSTRRPSPTPSRPPATPPAASASGTTARSTRTTPTAAASTSTTASPPATGASTSTRRSTTTARPCGATGYITDDLTDRAIGVHRRRTADRPFFCYLRVQHAALADAGAGPVLGPVQGRRR